MEVLATVLEWVRAFDDFLLGLVDGPLILLALLVFTTIDGFFPPVPSESIVIALAALSMTGEGPSLWVVIPVAALGAFLGDQIAFTIGRKIPVARIPFLNSGRGAELVAKANATVFRRPAPLLIAGRFIPGGRVAVNVSAGAMGFPRARFVRIDVVAAILWAIYSSILGLAAGAYLRDHPALSIVVGVLLGVLLGAIIDRIAVWWEKRTAHGAPSGGAEHTE
nr:DedA family protein [Actinomycetales bacterium]